MQTSEALDKPSQFTDVDLIYLQSGMKVIPENLPSISVKGYLFAGGSL